TGELYTRVGNFGFDGGSPQLLVDRSTGLHVLNTQGQPIELVSSVAAQATTQVTVSGNLPASAAEPLHGSSLQSLFSIDSKDGSDVTGMTLLSDSSLSPSGV